MDRSVLFNLRQTLTKHDPKTPTEKDQCRTESLVKKAYSEKLDKWGEVALRLFKIEHINYLSKRLVDLPTGIEHLDASQPWLGYWIIHGLRLLCYQLSNQQKCSVIALLKSCQHPEGGFAGGPRQLAHLAPTYGAINCLASLLSADALDIIDRQKLGDWLASLRLSNGSFLMHHGGEVDVRGAYCAVSSAALTGLLQSRPELFDGTAEWIASCQTYEGGFGGQPCVEAHGGYSFCAFAALRILQRTDLVDIPRLLKWAACRQMPTEGGFQGRTHKLVDSCYSFWLGALFPLIEQTLHEQSKTFSSSSSSTCLPKNSGALFDTSALQEYILLCCQRVFYMRPGLSVPIQQNKSDVNGGGLIDKPGRNVDPYHTCYALSGLSLAQHCPRVPSEAFDEDTDGPFPPAPCQDVAGAQWGNELADLDPTFNIVVDAVAFTRTYFTLRDSGVARETAIECAVEAADRVASEIDIAAVDDGVGDSGEGESPKTPDHLPNICTSP
ncbi:unnamed protein product [Mesocestoides corti]|uniref:Protein farnesyltransferase subunit beta n=1 Tax=Mesocestoides corti TaxID=53468 RepID=A0A0R3ULF3_MESCO|nr:unnamed protein product [Mesocestoides corti]